MSVQLIIKSAAQSVEDFQLNCEMSWTIAQVKDQISVLYPTKPAREHQKLIYGGKLLPDHLALKSILNTTQEINILHLVCPVPFKPESFKSHTNKSKTTPPACTVPPLNPDGIHPQQLPTPTVFANPPSVVAGTYAFGTPSDAVHQYLAMQQMYTQFLTQYFSQYNIATPYGQVPITPPAQQAVPVAPQQNVNQPEVRFERFDIIELLYLSSRALVLFVLLAFYSSPPRIMAVFVLVLILTMFAKMNRDRQRELMQRAAIVRQSAEDAIAQEAETNTENTEVTNEDATTEPQSSTVPETQSQITYSVPSTILTAVTTFFTSLIPEEAAPVNVN